MKDLSRESSEEVSSDVESEPLEKSKLQELESVDKADVGSGIAYEFLVSVYQNTLFHTGIHSSLWYTTHTLFSKTNLKDRRVYLDCCAWSPTRKDA